MRRARLCALMMTLLLLGGCAAGGEGESKKQEEALAAYRDMTGARATAGVDFTWNGELRQYVLQCDYQAGGSATVTVLAPEMMAGISAQFDGKAQTLLYEDLALDAGTLSDQNVSPAACLPQFLEALRSGYLLEEGKEKWGEIPCTRLTVDTTGEEGGKLLWTVWLAEESGLPVHGEVTVEEEIIFRLEFTDFSFHDTIAQNESEVEN